MPCYAAAYGMARAAAEITGGLMVLADYLRTKLVVPLQEKLRDEGRAQGHAQGHAQGRAAERLEWRAWNRRRREAEARGASFDEPEPYSDYE